MVVEDILSALLDDIQPVLPGLKNKNTKSKQDNYLKARENNYLMKWLGRACQCNFLIL